MDTALVAAFSVFLSAPISFYIGWLRGSKTKQESLDVFPEVVQESVPSLPNYEEMSLEDLEEAKTEMKNVFRLQYEALDKLYRARLGGD